MANIMEILGLTEEQLRILYSLEYELCQIDYYQDKKVKEYKVNWLGRWETALNQVPGLYPAIPYRSEIKLIEAMKEEASKSVSKEWLYLVMLEATLFTPYTPLGESKEDDKEYKKLNYSDKSLHLRSIAGRSGLINPEYIDRFKKTYKKSIDRLQGGKLKKVAIGAVGVVALAAIGAATAGAAAGPIAVMLFGESFAGLGGAALTSACLAMAGGGAIAVGGMGMAGGIAAIAGGGALLGATAGGTAFAGAAAVFGKKSPDITLIEAAKLEVVMKEITLNAQKDIQNAQDIIAALKKQIDDLMGVIAYQKAQRSKDKETLANLEKNYEILKKAYEEMVKYSSSFAVGLNVLK